MFCLVVLGHMIVHGKAFATFLAGGSDSPVRVPFSNLQSTVLIIVIAAFFEFLRATNLMLDGVKLLISAAIGIGISSISFFYAKSYMVVFLTMYAFIIATSIVFLAPYMKQSMETEFWELIINFSFGVMRFVVLIFVAAVAVLEFAYGALEEDVEGYYSTILYPALVIIFTFGMLSLWIILPSWANLASARRKSPHK